MFTNIKIILRWITKYWYPRLPLLETYSFIDTWINLIQVWIKNNGILPTIKRIKLIRLITTRYICGSPLRVNDYMVGVDKDGFASSIGFLKPLVDSKDPQSLRFVLTLLGVSRSFPSPAPVDYSSITAPSKAKYVKIDNEFIVSFVRDYTGHFNPLSERPSPSRSFLSLKAGPAGGPAILTAALAAANFTGVNLRGLAMIGGDRFMEWVKALKFSISFREVNRKFFGVKAGKLIHEKIEVRNRRFLHISDPEGKHRVVAAYDYLSQLAFTPFSEWCFNALRLIPNDRTFTQNPVIKDKKEGNNFHSFDLSSATDRFPIQLQEQLIAEIAGPGFANAWKALMINEPFLAHFCGPKGKDISLLKYSVGQPMGARSSWAAFTLSHHLVVQYAAHLCNKYPFKEYILLGDDIVIYDNDVAAKYLQIINDLGVDISPSKSHISENCYEFAKRWFFNGIEISPIPMAGLVSNFDQPQLIFQQIIDLVRSNRGPRLIIHIPDMVLELFRLLRRDDTTVSNGGFFCFLSGHITRYHLYQTKEIKKLKVMLNQLYVVSRNLYNFDPLMTRSFMAEASSSNEYVIPPTDATLFQEWRRTSSGVVNGMAMSYLKRLSDFYRVFKESYNEILTHQACDTGTLPVNSHPLTHAIYQSVFRFSEMNKAMNYTTDLEKQLETITLIDIDRLRNHERTSNNLIFHYGTLGRKLAYQLRTDPDLYIAKARSMQFGRSLLDIRFAMEREFPNLKLGKWN